MTPRNPNDPYLNAPADDMRRDQPIDPLPPAENSSTSGGRMALYGLAVLALIAALFYGMSSTGTNTAQNKPQNTSASNSAAPGAVRNVTPGPNSSPGTTTGSSATSPAPAPAPSSSQSGSGAQ